MLTTRMTAMPAQETFIANADATLRPPLNTTPLFIRAGDVLDFGIDWSAWLDANAARLKTSSWAAAGSPAASPQSPTLSSPLMDAGTGVTSTLVDASSASVGDEYYIENTIVVVPSGGSPLTWADRTIKRRLDIKVVGG